MNDPFMALALVLGLAALGGMLATVLRQPALLGYLIAGGLISHFGLGHGGSSMTAEMVEVMGQIGVTLLLFLVGLELPIAELRKMGKVALYTGLGQIVFTALAGWIILKLLGFDSLTGIYLAVALTFSSTIVVVKLLSQIGDLHSLHGKIAVGFLLVQDFVAIGILVVLAGMEKGGSIAGNLAEVAVKGVLMVAMVLWLSEKIMPKVAAFIGKSTEILFVMAIGWCLVIAGLMASPVFGMSLEVGGFLAGLALAGAAQHFQIAARVSPLRDFFITLFFVSLGAQVGLGDLGSMWLPAIILSIFVLVGNPLIVMAILGFMGYRRRTSFMAGITVAQISEFSLVVVATALRSGHVASSALALITLVGAITMTFSSYLILYSHHIYRRIGKYLWIFERQIKSSPGIIPDRTTEWNTLLFGHNRTGSRIRPILDKMGFKVLVVDFNPEEVELLERMGVRVWYGDISDHELYEQPGMNKVELVISTVPDVHDNLRLLGYVNDNFKPRVVVVTAADEIDAQRLYQAGADYVLIPKLAGGDYLAGSIEHYARGGNEKTKIQALKKYFRERVSEGRAGK